MKKKTERQIRKEIGEKIKDLREEYNQYTYFINPQRLADFLGIPLAEYMAIEFGKKPIGVVYLQKLANLYDVPLTYFMDEKVREKTKIKPYKFCGFKPEPKDSTFKDVKDNP